MEHLSYYLDPHHKELKFILRFGVFCFFPWSFGCFRHESFKSAFPHLSKKSLGFSVCEFKCCSHELPCIFVCQYSKQHEQGFFCQ